MAGSGSQRFWDRRARENALYFVDTRLDYVEPDEAYFWNGGEEVLQTMLDRVAATIRPTDRVLDIGCGVGRLTRPLAVRAASVVAIDVSSEMLARAQELNGGLENVEWIHGDGETLRPLAGVSVDACLSHVVFQHIADPEVTLGYLREIGRVLRPGGWALVEVSTDPAVHRRPGLAGIAWILRSVVGRAPRGIYSPDWVGSAVDERNLRQAAADGGLEVVKLLDPGTQYTTLYARRRAE